MRLQRSNSAHEKVDASQSVKTNFSRPNRNSVADFIDVKIDSQPVKTAHLTNGDKAPAKPETQSSVVQIRSLKPDQSQVNRTSVEVKSLKTDSESIPRASQNTLTEARSKLKTVFNSQNIGTLPNKSFNMQLNVSSNVNRSRTFAGGDIKRLSNGLQYDSGKTNDSADKESNNIRETANDNKVPVPKEPVKMSGNNDKVNKSVNLGPMASQKKFISSSTGNLLHSEKSNIDRPKPEVVKGLQPTKPKSVIVMSHDKQMIDLDSFTTRKDMLAEIKQFDKELKHTKTKDSREGKLTEIGSMSGGSYKVAEKNGETSSKNNLMDEIKLSKKPSEIVNAKEQKVTVKTDTKENKDIRKETSKSTKVTIDLQPTKEQTKVESKVESKSKESLDTVDSQMQKFDDLLNVDDEKISSLKKSTQNEVLPSVSMIDEPRDVITDPGQAARVGERKIIQEPEESTREETEVGEDERFVSEFQFPQPKVKVKEVTQTKQVKKGKSTKIIICCCFLEIFHTCKTNLIHSTESGPTLQNRVEASMWWSG